MTVIDPIARLRAAAGPHGAGSSDFDLNPDFVLPEGRKTRQAGVLCAFRDGPDGPELLLTKRASHLKHHPGQIAFPGGKVDDGDDGPIGAALREAMEEVGLPPENVDIIGTMPTHETVTGFVVTPILGWIRDDFVEIPEAGEVDEVFYVPMAHVMDPRRYSVQSRNWQGMRRHYFTVPYGPYYIWGATARMLRLLAERMAEK